MGASQEATTRMAELIRIARNREERDRRLEQLYDITARATEWDADQWGFGPDVWMARERQEMNRRAAGKAGLLPTEPMMRVRTDAQMAAETGAAGRGRAPRQATHDGF